MSNNVVDPSRSPGLESIPIEDAFRADLAKFYSIELGSPTPPLRQRAWLWTRHFGLHCVAAYRLHRYARRQLREHPVLVRPLLTLAQALSYGMRLVHHVELNAEVGPGFYIGHASNIFVGPTRIGRNFSITHNVTIGVGHQRLAPGIPVIGDDVWVGTGSVLSGAIRVGNSVTVSNGTMLSRTVPDGCLVGGNPGRVVQPSYDNNPLFSHRGAQAEAEH
ncbi:MAG: serine acetyltransferase [Deltaproteobacteria bacterium]|nr:serine acetyltransferase [Deltaproteobacteria bacterium]